MSPGQSTHGNHSYQTPRHAYNAGASGYRGSSVPVQPYAFTSTPNLSQSLSWQQYGSYRTNSSPVTGPSPTYDSGMNYRAALQSGLQPANTGYSNSLGANYGTSRDDSAITSPRNISPSARPQSYLSVGTQPSFSSSTSNKNTPDRYRRPVASPTQHGRSQSSNLSPTLPMVNPNQIYQDNRRFSTSNLSGQHNLASASMDDLQLYRRSAQDESMRLRRRSMHTIDTKDLPGSRQNLGDASDVKQVRRVSPSPTAHSRTGSSESVASSRSSHSRPSSVSSKCFYFHARFISLDETSVYACMPCC